MKDWIATKKAGLLAVAALSVAAAGCSGAAAATSDTLTHRHTKAEQRIQQVTIDATNALRFVPSTIRIRPGRVRITLVDKGAYPHNIVIPALKVYSSSVTGDIGGTKVSFVANFPRRGRYYFYCAYHRFAGMVGVFIVS